MSRARRKQQRARVRPGARWYNITTTPDVAEVAIYDEIGYWGLTAEQFLTELREIDAPEIHLRINSVGGEIFDGIAIYNTLRSHTAKVTVYVDALAASIASVIAMAGDKVIMQPHSQMMIHDGSGLCIGNAADMREMADQLDRQSDNIASVYAERAGGTVRQWRQRMLAETWYSAAEAVEAGLADEVGAPPRRGDDDLMGNTWDLTVFAYAGRESAPAPTVRESLTVQPVPVPAPEPVPEPTATAEPDELVELVEPAELTDWDPALFRESLTAAIDEQFATAYDPDLLRDAIRERTSNAPIVAVAGEEPESEPESVAEQPAEPQPAEPDDDDPYDPDVFRAAVRARAFNAPAPPTPAAPTPDPEADPYDPTVVKRALEEAYR